MSLADNISIFPGVTPNRYDPKITLEAAARADLQDVIVIGWDGEGELFFSASNGDGPECLWLIEKAKAALLCAGESGN
jgi:hypothetical protein